MRRLYIVIDGTAPKALRFAAVGDSERKVDQDGIVFMMIWGHGCLRCR